MSDSQQTVGFVDRHVGPDERDVEAMLASLGYPSLDALIQATVPAAILRHDDLGLFAAIGFLEADLVVVAQVGAARRSAALLALGAEEFGEHIAEHVAENVFRAAMCAAGSASRFTPSLIHWWIKWYGREPTSNTLRPSCGTAPTGLRSIRLLSGFTRSNRRPCRSFTSAS